MAFTINPEISRVRTDGKWMNKQMSKWMNCPLLRNTGFPEL